MLLPGGTATYIATCAIDPTVSGTLTNTVTVDPPLGLLDPDLSDNTATDVDTLVPTADLEANKLASADPVVAGSAPGRV